MSGSDEIGIQSQKLKICLIVSFLVSFFIFKFPVLADGIKPPNFQESLKVTDSRIHFSSCENRNSVSCIGTIKNSSAEVWEEVEIEVQYFNKENSLIDTATEYIYGLVVPANDTATFRVREEADKSESEYHSHKVRITSATTNTNKPPSRTKNKTLTNVLISWTPMMLLIAVWIIFMRKYSGKNSPQRATMGILKEQVELIKEQNSLFKDLIQVIANHAAKIEQKNE